MKYTQLVQAVASVNGAKFISIDALTEVKLRGGMSNPHQGRVTKRMTKARVAVFQNKVINGYDAMVKRRLEAEGKDPNNFVLSPRAWGTRVPNMPIVVHEKDGQVKYYLEVIFMSPGHVEYRLDGVPCNKSDIIGLIEARPAEQGGLDNKVILRDFAADSITEIRIDGKAFQ